MTEKEKYSLLCDMVADFVDQTNKTVGNNILDLMQWMDEKANGKKEAANGNQATNAS